MRAIPLSIKRLIACGIWLTGVCIFALLALWNIHDSEMDAENRLLAEAGRSAAQLAGVLDLPGYPLNPVSVSPIIRGAMEDEHVYAVRVDDNSGLVAGQRRNYLWDPIPWDDEIPENCVQGVSNLRFNGKIVGSVSIWLSPRIYKEETAQITRREIHRFILLFIMWTLALLLVLLNWGDFHRMFHHFNKKKNDGAQAVLPSPMQKEATVTDKNGEVLFDAETGRRYQRRNPDSFRVTAGMFRQTFARGPDLISKLYARGEFASLSHLGRMLELAAPCIGATCLLNAARNMQNALNDPENEKQAIPVEECARILTQVLNALNGKEQWLIKKSTPGSE